MADLDELRHQAQQKLLEQLAQAESPAAALQYAEAYAWVARPDQPHGGAGATAGE